jgi:outer membrane protein
VRIKDLTKMKRVLLFSLFFLSTRVTFPQKLTLKESIELGLKNSKALIISRSKLTGSDAKITEATSQLLPQFKFAAGYTRLSNIPAFQVSLPFLTSPITISDVILNTYNMRLSMQQPIFTGFRLSALRSSAVSNNKAAESEFLTEYNETAFKIHIAFWQYYKAIQLAAVIDENLAQMEKHLNDTKNFLENGLATQNDLLKLEAQFSNTKLLQIESQNNLDVTRFAFNQTIGLPPESGTDIDSDIDSANEADIDYNSLLSEAKSNRNELKALNYRLEASNKGITAAKAGWFPSLYLSGNYYYNRPNQRIMPALDKFKDTWDLGVTLNWDIWNWGLTSAQSIQAEQIKIQTETSLHQMNDAVEIEVYQNYLSYKRSFEKILVSKTSLDQAKENYRTTKEKYNVQLATSTDLIDSESALLQAEMNYSNSLIDNKIAKTRLEKSVGRKIY